MLNRLIDRLQDIGASQQANIMFAEHDSWFEDDGSVVILGGAVQAVLGPPELAKCCTSTRIQFDQLLAHDNIIAT